MLVEFVMIGAIQLCQAGNLDGPRDADECIEKPTDKQPVFQVVRFLEQVGSFLAMASQRIATRRAIRDIPLIERKPQRLKTVDGLVPDHKPRVSPLSVFPY